MINIDFTNIDNAKLIGRLLPFWARGKKISLLLQALLFPICSVFAAFKAWALQKYIECHITAQKPMLEWYLNYKLKSHFSNPSDSFCIVSGIDMSISCFSTEIWRNGLHWDNALRWNAHTEPQVNLNMNLSCINTGLWGNNMCWNNSLLWYDEANGIDYDDEYMESTSVTNVYAPMIVETINYSKEDYMRDIRYILSKFMINFNRLNIIIVDSAH